MKNKDYFNENVWLSFETTRGTNELLNKLANIKGKTQPQLLDEICQTYIQNTLADIILNLENSGINIIELLKKEET